jgi:oligoendopeptidase F
MDTAVTESVSKPVRHYLPQNFKVETWDSLKSYFDELADRTIESAEDLKQWLLDGSELSAIIDEDGRWRYINTSTDTNSESARQALEFYFTQLASHYQSYFFLFNKKLMSSPFIGQLNDKDYEIFLKRVKMQLAIFREENIPLTQQIGMRANDYDVISGKQSIIINEQEVSLNQAQVYMRSTDRSVREDIFRKSLTRRLEDREALDVLFDDLIKLRHQVALNAGYQNFRDYQFDAMERFDYNPEDCYLFHESIHKVVVPVTLQLMRERKEALALDALRPWDLEVDVKGKEPLKPFHNMEEFLDKHIQCLNAVDPYFGNCVRIMNNMKLLDLDARLGKATGGYNMSLPETGVPFVFMNAAMSEGDIRVMTHESGHAVHSFLSNGLALVHFKEAPTEVAELASMSMELFCMENWGVFYDNEDDMRDAKKRHIEGLLGTLTSVCVNDAFQHWMYLNPTHSHAERSDKFETLNKKFKGGVVDWIGVEEGHRYNWQRVMHIYQVPFYYIEYAFAQLGAIAMYKQYKENKEQAIANYKAALSLGYTRSIAEIYETAGIRFDFSEAYIAELTNFIIAEYKALG